MPGERPAARVTDMHVCPMVTGVVPHVGGPIVKGAPNVLVGGLPAARISDLLVCVGPPDVIASGAFTVLVGGLPAARIGDQTVHGGVIVMGWPTVMIGDAAGAGAGAGAGGPAGPPPATGSGVAGVPGQASSEAEKLARKLTQAGGSATQDDVDLVVAELAKMPAKDLAVLDKAGTKVVAARGSVTDHRASLKGVAPRGWPPGSTWDSVPGAYMGDTNEVVIATVGHGTPAGAHVPKAGEGHGSANIVVHEAMHGVDHALGAGAGSRDPAFLKARTADLAGLSPYQKQPGVAGAEESYAETAARYASDPRMAKDLPNLHQYWHGGGTR